MRNWGWITYFSAFLSIWLFPSSSFAFMTATGFGGVTEYQMQEGGTAGVAFSVVKVIEVDTGLMWNGGLHWYGNMGFRFQAPSSQYDWFSPYFIIGAGKFGEHSTTQGGIGVNISVLRLDYRYIAIDKIREDINRLYLGLEFEFGHFP